MRDELAKPEGKRVQPDPEAVHEALREQLGPKLTSAKRTVSVVVVQPTNDLRAAANPK